MPPVTSSARTYVARAYRDTPVPGPLERHMMNRMGCGFSSATLTRMRAAGGARAWFEQQLTPSSVPQAAKVADLDTWFPSLAESMETKYRNSEAKRKLGWEYGVEFGNWSMLRRIFSTRSVYENMVDLWSNHFHVSAYTGHSWVPRKGYDSTIRAHALGRFEDLLIGVSLHPAMLLYLDNFRSTVGAPNENQGRELLELHTVGRDSGYSEDMVKSSAVILSGWTVYDKTTFERYYNPAAHTTGRVRVLDFTHENATPDGSAVATAYLSYLARHPATARTVARKLAVRFVSDTPSEALIDRLAQVFLDSDTDIKSVLRALVDSPEFAASADAKVRTPVDDLVATARALRVNPSRPVHAGAFARDMSHIHGGDRLYDWPRPDGSPQTNAEWCSASRMLNSYRMHWGMAGGFYPKVDVVYRPRPAWMPKKRMRFDVYVDHLCRVLLGRRSTALLLQAACEATRLPPTEVVTKTHPVSTFLFPRLVGALLDSPAHMTR
ncbi:DUF1800 domain-containing protein [Nocardioides sp.]|uniref:DUF1800 domain-containing protein n=1 Tax=Nocardioides sp. TaxID=35761 RepID=UPI003D10A6D3